MKLFAAFEASIALSSAMCPMLTNSSRVLRESRTIQIIEPICSTAGSPISITNETMPGFLTTSLQQSLQNLACAFDGFFARRAKYPRFKSKHGRQSIQCPQRVKLDGNRI